LSVTMPVIPRSEGDGNEPVDFIETLRVSAEFVDKRRREGARVGGVDVIGVGFKRVGEAGSCCVIKRVENGIAIAADGGGETIFIGDIEIEFHQELIVVVGRATERCLDAAVGRGNETLGDVGLRDGIEF